MLKKRVVVEVFLLCLVTLFCNGFKEPQQLTITSVNSAAALYVGNTNRANGRMQLELLLREGLQESDYVFEIGCGALLAGIPIISFLDAGHYVGVDPNKWLIDASLSIKENRDIADEKNPTFLYNANFDGSDAHMTFDYIIAHSIMSHAADWQLDLFLENCAKVLKKGGKVVFSIRLTEPNVFGGTGAPRETHSQHWVYPGNSFFHRDTVIQKALQFFEKVEEKILYTELITSTDKGAFHDWFVLTK